MATTITPVRVHEAEVSTDRDALAPYAEPLLVLLAVVALAAAVWIATLPGDTADLQQPSRATPSRFDVGAPGSTSTQVDAATIGGLPAVFEASVVAPLDGGVPAPAPTPSLAPVRQGPALPPYTP